VIYIQKSLPRKTARQKDFLKDFLCGVHIHHTNILFREDYRCVVLVFLNFFLRLKYQKNMAPKKTKVKKRVAQPAKGIIERTICAHPMLKRVQKEVRELKKKSAKKHKK
jgi:hypothetical protein